MVPDFGQAHPLIRTSPFAKTFVSGLKVHITTTSSFDYKNKINRFFHIIYIGYLVFKNLASFMAAKSGEKLDEGKSFGVLPSSSD